MEIILQHKKKQKQNACTVVEKIVEGLGDFQAELSNSISLRVVANQKDRSDGVNKSQLEWLRGNMIKCLIRGYHHDHRKIGFNQVLNAINALNASDKQLIERVYVAVPRADYLCVSPDWQLCWGKEPSQT